MYNMYNVVGKYFVKKHSRVYSHYKTISVELYN